MSTSDDAQPGDGEQPEAAPQPEEQPEGESPLLQLREYLSAHLGRSAQALGLPAAAVRLLWSLVPVEVDAQVAADMERNDVHNRRGVVPWTSLSMNAQDAQAGAVAAWRWGLIDVVGALSSDPRTSGPAPLRLSYVGRVALGLAPHLQPPVQRDWSEGEHAWSGRWCILHSASREAALARATERVGKGAEAIWLDPPARDVESWLHRTAGQIALRIIVSGAVVLDAFDVDENQRGVLREAHLPHLRGPGRPGAADGRSARGPGRVPPPPAHGRVGGA